MGSSGPLDHPELREVERLLDGRDLSEAQRLLAQLGSRIELAEGVAYLTTRLLYARGRLDLKGVADRLRDLLVRSPDFAEANLWLEQAESRKRSDQPAPPAEETPVAEAPPRRVEVEPEPFAAAEPAGERAEAREFGSPLDGSQSVFDAAHSLSAGERDPFDPSLHELPTTPWSERPDETPRPTSRPPPPAKIRIYEATLPHGTAFSEPAPGASRSTGTSQIVDDSRFASFDEERRRRGSRPPDLGSSRPPRPPMNTPLDAAETAKRRSFTPLTGFSALSRPSAAAAPARKNGGPDIPRAPGLPQFRDDGAPPSYAPVRGEPDIDAFRSKSLLPRNAGRYSESPRAPDIFGAGRRGAKNARPSSKPPFPKVQPRQSSHPPGQIRSGTPLSPAPLPSLFEIASWIDEGRHREAIAAINRAGPDAGAEYAVLRARALAGAGYVDQASDALEKLEGAPLLDPELRAACARLFIELGDPERGLKLAEHALIAEPERPLVRLTYALAAVRTSRRRRDGALLDRAEEALQRLQGREGPLPALCQALKACVEASAGDPERAISIAQRALGLDPKSPDALAAIAEASARLGRNHDARQATARLAEIAPGESEPVAAVLARIGSAAAGRAEAPVAEGPVWSSVETDVVGGRRNEAIRAVELAAHEAVRRMSKSASQSGLTAIASVTASFLTTAAVFSSFAPFDQSLYSVRRLDAALDVLYGPDRRPALSTDDSGMVMLLGAYVGEALRLSQDGHWDGRPTDLDAVRVVIGQRQYHPFRIVAARLHHGRRAAIVDAFGTGISKPGTDSWRVRISNPLSPPVPWSPQPWPKPSRIAVLGRSLSRSPIGKFCEDFAEGPLDGTMASLIALDTYLGLVSPLDAPRDTDAAWTRRVAALVGGYLGETLRELVSGEWIFGVDVADDAHAFRLKLRGSTEAMPVAHVLERVAGDRSSTLVDYAKTLMRRAGRM